MTRTLGVAPMLFILACGGGSPPPTPTIPTPPPPAAHPAPAPPAPASVGSARVWAMVISESGVCIPATVQATAGQAVGQIGVQSDGCDAWSYDGGVVFENLTPGIEMTLRASAPGYVSEDVTVVPRLGAQSAILIAPSPIRR